MNTSNHYTDDDFQNYLDGSFENDKKTFEAHLRDCIHCNNNYEAYKAVWNFVGHSLKTESLNIDLASRVIQKAMPVKQNKPLSEKVIYALCFLIGSICLFSCIYYLVSHPLPISFLLLVIPLVLYFLLTYKEIKLLEGKFTP